MQAIAYHEAFPLYPPSFGITPLSPSASKDADSLKMRSEESDRRAQDIPCAFRGPSLLEQWKRNRPPSVRAQCGSPSLASPGSPSATSSSLRVRASLTLPKGPRASAVVSSILSLPQGTQEACCAASTRMISCHPSRSVEEVKRFLSERACAVLQEMVEDSAARCQQCQASGDVEILKSGVFYYNDYCRLMKRFNVERHEVLRGENSYFSGKPPEEFFERGSNRTKPGNYRFALKAGKSASEGVDALRAGMTLTGSAEMCFISYFTALRDLLGKEKFDVLFAADSKTPLVIYAARPTSVIACLLSMLQPAQQRDPEKGDLVLFCNASSYPQKHLLGHARCLCLLCDGDRGRKTYSGVGAQRSSSEEQVMKFLLKEYNESPLIVDLGCEDLFPKDFLCCMEQSNPHKEDCLTLSDLKRESAGINGVAQPRYDLIAQLANSSIEEARALLTGWWNEHVCSPHFRGWKSASK